MIITLGRLTKEQQEFAAENHYLVENFLKFRNLNANEYYDVIIFGFLRAVRNYFMRPELQEYNFSTIAQYSMKSDLINHYRKQGRKKRRAYVFSLDRQDYDDNDMTIAETVAAPDTTSDYLDAEIICNHISANLSDEHVKILNMKTYGYSEKEIAKNYGISVKDIDYMMKQIRETVGNMRLVNN